MNSPYVLVSSLALRKTNPVTYHAFSNRTRGFSMATTCGLRWGEWNDQGRVVVTWPIIHVEHARRIGRPCSRCFPGDDK